MYIVKNSTTVTDWLIDFRKNYFLTYDYTYEESGYKLWVE